MIEIITGDGTSLDLKPNEEFEVTLEQPLLSEDHIPVPYSTSISFLPTVKNRKTFGYLGAMMLAPQVLRLSVEIRCNGIPMFYGVLEYESIEDGNLNYTFSGKNIEDSYQGYIHEVEHLTNIEGAILEASGKILSMIRTAADGTNDEFGVPMLVCKSNITEIEYPNDLEKDPVSWDAKYQNYIWQLPFASVTPAVRVSKILEKCLSDVVIDDNLKEVYDKLAILGQYKDANSFNVLGIPVVDGKVKFNLANSLPECTLYDLFTNVAKMLCASMYRDGDGYRVICNSTVLSSTSILDWDNKTCDDFSAEAATRMSYTFGYSNNDSENTYEPTGKSDDWENANIVEVSTIGTVITTVISHTDYVAVRHTPSGDMYSGKKMVLDLSNGSKGTAPFMDVLLHNIAKVDTNNSEEEIFDNTVSFIAVCCMPTKTYGIASSGVPQYCMCPVLDFPAIGSERQTDIFIGVLANNQLTDKGTVFNTPTSTPEVSTTQETRTGISIAPAALYDKYHKGFAEWLAKDRQILTVSLQLNMNDIHEFRMWNKITVRHRVWLVKTIRFTFNTSKNTVETSADLIEIP